MELDKNKLIVQSKKLGFTNIDQLELYELE